MIRSTAVALALITATSSVALARLDCGRVQARHFGVGSACATEWAYDFPHTSAQPGAVVVQRRGGGRNGCPHGPGHVSRIISVVDSCHAVVADEKGRYTRDICRNQIAIVMPDANGNRASSTHNFSARRGRHRHFQHRDPVPRFAAGPDFTAH